LKRKISKEEQCEELFCRGRATFAAGMKKEVSLDPVNGAIVNSAINDRIDEAYRAKYKTSPYLKPMIGPSARSATVKVVPRETKT